MNNRKRNRLLCALLIGSLALTGCGIRDKKPQSADVINPAGETVIDQTSPVTPSPAVTPTVEVTPGPLLTPPPAASPAQTLTPGLNQTTTPTPTPIPIQTPAPGQGSGSSSGSSQSGSQSTNSALPTVTKNPTSETVAPGGSCWFVAKYTNAVYAEWHFVSPDGTRDLDYEQAGKEFTTLEIVDGYASSMQLKNIPSSLNGWSVYCRFSNKAGAVKTSKASITVTGSAQSGVPLITKNPTSETVAPGGACSFVARYKDAIWAEWHFVSPDGARDILYTQAVSEFPGVTISGGNTAVLKLSTIPSSLNGWSVYCRFTNNMGGANTSSASITVTGSGSATIVPDSGGTVIPGDPANPYPSGSGGAGTVVPGDPADPYPGGSGTVIPGDPGNPGPGGSGTVVPGDPGNPGVIIIG